MYSLTALCYLHNKLLCFKNKYEGIAKIKKKSNHFQVNLAEYSVN